MEQLILSALEASRVKGQHDNSGGGVGAGMGKKGAPVLIYKHLCTWAHVCPRVSSRTFLSSLVLSMSMAGTPLSGAGGRVIMSKIQTRSGCVIWHKSLSLSEPPWHDVP